jgi:hypothetical protein
MPAAIFIVAVLTSCLPLPAEGTAERGSVDRGENLRLLRTQTVCPFVPSQSHMSSRDFSAFLGPLSFSRSYRLNTDQNGEGKITENWRASAFCDTGDSTAFFFHINPSGLHRVLMGRGPPIRAGEVNVHLFPPSCFVFARAFNSIINFCWSTKRRSEIPRAVNVEVCSRETEPSGILNGRLKRFECESSSGNAVQK